MNAFEIQEPRAESTGFDTAILFLIFNRPDLAEITFSRIREIQPKYLYIAADGPKSTDWECIEKSRITRETVISMIDWDCKVKKRFSDFNEGPGLGPFNSISWFFEEVPYGIIVEDDCLASKSFFYFAEALLKKFISDERLFQINGNLTIANSLIDDHSYFFSHYPHIWGWATWARSWRLVKRRVEISEVDRVINNTSLTTTEKKYWINFFSTTNLENYWDAQLLYAHFKYLKFSIFPTSNLILNIGFGNSATNTKIEPEFHSRLQLNEFIIQSHPKKVERNKVRDLVHFQLTQGGATLNQCEKSLIFCKKTLKKMIRQIINFLGYEVSVVKNSQVTKNDKQIRIGSKFITVDAAHHLDVYTKSYVSYDRFLSLLTRQFERKFNSLEFIDVGANVGDTAISISESTKCIIHCFEGDPFYLKYLRDNTASIAKRVNIHNVFLGEKTALIPYEFTLGNGTGKLLNSNFDKTQIFKLDDLINNKALSINSKHLVFKIDTDGFDLKIIEGAKALINKFKPIIFFELDIFLLENADTQIHNLISAFQTEGYSTAYVFDNFGDFLFKTKIEDEAFINILHYPERSQKRIYYFDICLLPNNQDYIQLLDEITIHYK